MFKNPDHLIESGVRTTPYEEKSYVVTAVRKLDLEYGSDEPGPYGRGLLSFYTEGISKNKPFGHVVDVSDIILIQ